MINLDIFIKRVESKSIVNVDMITQEIEEHKLYKNMGKDEINPYHEINTNKIDKGNIITMHMEQWSILSNVVNYVQYDRHPRNFYDLDIKTVDQKGHKEIYDKF